MKFIRYPFFFFLLVIMACSHTSKDSGGWHNSMREMSDSLADVMPALVSRPDRPDALKKEVLERAISELKAYSKDVKDSDLPPSLDPTVKYIAQNFYRSIREMDNRIHAGNFERSKDQLKETTKFCISCHLKASGSTSAYSFGKSTRLFGYTNYEKAVYYSAIRRYEDAIIHFEYALTDKEWAKTHPDEWDNGVMTMLSIIVRVKKDPDLALEMLAQFFDTGSFPSKLKQAALTWRMNAKEWRENPQEITFSQARRFTQEADRLNKKTNRAGLFLNLRASSKLYEMLRAGAGKDVQRKQEILYLAGKVSERLSDFSYSEMPEYYFQACADVDSSSRLGKLCRRK